MNVFNRIETKYLITNEQYNKILKAITNNGFKSDEYGESVIQSIYYDTPDKCLIKRSIEKPIFKEKIRIRNYGSKTSDKVYLEIKRKFKGTVYKRRIQTSLNDCDKFFNYNMNFDTQIGKELNSFRDQYKNLSKSCRIVSKRIAYFNKTSDIRFTFDSDIKYSNTSFSFDDLINLKPITKENEVLLEIKSQANYPLWLVRILNDNNIYKTNFSKYGNAFIKEFMGE